MSNKKLPVDHLRETWQRDIEGHAEINQFSAETRKRQGPATTPRPNCKWCNKRLRRSHAYIAKRYEGSGRSGEWGDYGDGFFCGLSCGYAWAVWQLKGEK